MSDSLIIVIPRSPSFEPTVEAARNSRRYLKEQLPGVLTGIRFCRDTTFMHAGVALDRIWCPLCEASLTHEWFYAAVDVASRSRFRELGVEMPCCRRLGNLNELGWNAPVGFAKFDLYAVNASVPDLTLKQAMDVERILGCGITRIRRRDETSQWHPGAHI